MELTPIISNSVMRISWRDAFC